MLEYKEFSNRPWVSREPARLPFKAMLALPDYVTRDQTVPWFNLPVGAAQMLGDWSRANRVLDVRVWAPALSNSQYVTNFLGKIPGLPSAADFGFLRSSGFFGEQRPMHNTDTRARCDIVYFIGNCKRVRFRDPLLDLGEKGASKLTVSELLTRFRNAETRLFIFQLADAKFLREALDLSTNIAGSEGPSVLTISAGDVGILNEYSFNLFRTILHNEDLKIAADVPSWLEERQSRLPDKLKLSAHLFCGIRGKDLLRLDDWMGELSKTLESLVVECDQSRRALRRIRADVSSLLHQQQQQKLLGAFEIETARTSDLLEGTTQLFQNLDKLKDTHWFHETEGALPLTELAEDVSRLREKVRDVGKNPPETWGQPRGFGFRAPEAFEYLHNELERQAASAPRVLNAGFGDNEIGAILKPHEALLAGREYDFLVDVGPRWNTIPSLVTGHAEFPEKALPADVQGFPVDVLFVSGDFTPNVLSGQIWVPRKVGRSFSVQNGKRQDKAGPLLLRLRAPSFLDDNKEKTLTARGRLNLYFRGNLLQSAAVQAGVARQPNTRLEKKNVVDVDYVLSSSMQEVESRYSLRAVKFTPEEAGEGHPVAVNVMLNDDGAGGDRIVVFANHDGVPVHAAPPPAWKPYNPLGTSHTLERARGELRSCFQRRDDNGMLLNADGFESDHRKTKKQFMFDLRALARLGADLFTEVTSGVRIENNTMGALQWAKTLQALLARSAVIQIARTESAAYVFPWALVYDIPMPGPTFNFCGVLNEWDDSGIRKGGMRTSCPFADQPDHQENIYCPYGFWGLKHIIEQPPSPLVKENSQWKLFDAEKEIPSEHQIPLSVAYTRDPTLDLNDIDRHIQQLRSNPLLSFVKGAPAEDVIGARAVLESPTIVYFLCHGKRDPDENKPYLGIGDPDDRKHQIFPTTVNGWARSSQSPNLSAWRVRRPLIFINGCHTSELKPEETLNFVEQFTLAQASGVLGTEISVKLSLATEVADFLIMAIASGMAVGQALHNMRWTLANKGNLLGFAYTLFALADLHIVRSNT